MDVYRCSYVPLRFENNILYYKMYFFSCIVVCPARCDVKYLLQIMSCKSTLSQQSKRRSWLSCEEKHSVSFLFVFVFVFVYMRVCACPADVSFCRSWLSSDEKFNRRRRLSSDDTNGKSRIPGILNKSQDSFTPSQPLFHKLPVQAFTLSARTSQRTSAKVFLVKI